MSDDVSGLILNTKTEGDRAARLARLRSIGESAQPQRSIGEKISRIPGDVAKGATETPMAIVSGVRDALDEVLNLGEGVEQDLIKNSSFYPGLQITDPETGKLALKFVNLSDPENADIKDFELPDVRKPKSNTGAFIEGAAQFLTGFAGAGSALKAGNLLQGLGKGSVIARGAAQGALADFAAFDPHEERLSNFVESVPGLSNPVTEYLAASDDDTEIEGRIKNVIEGAGLGVATEGILKALKATRKVRSAKKTLEDAVAEPVEVTADRIRGEQIQKDFNDVAAAIETPLFDRKLDAAERATASTPPGAAAELSDAARRWRDATKALQPERFADDGDLKALDGVDFNEVDTIMWMVEAVRKPIDEPERLFQFVASKGGIKDRDGVVKAMLGGERVSLTKAGVIDDRGKFRILAKEIDEADPAQASLIGGSGGAAPAAGKGLDLDDMALYAWEAGYFHNTRIGKTIEDTGARPTGDDLVELLRRDIQGESPVYRETDIDRASALDVRNKAEEHLDRLGIDWSDRSLKRVREQVEGVASLQFPRDGTGTRTADDLAAEAAARNAAGANGLTIRQRADLGGESIYVNFAKIDTEEDVKSIIGQMADAFADDINKARGGATKSVLSQNLSAGHIDAFDVLAKRRDGEPLNAAQFQAVRQLWAASGEKLRQAAMQAQSSGSPGAIMAFRKMMAVHHAIQREVIAARTETARALRQWAVPAGDSVRMAQAIDRLIGEGGGLKANVELARKIATLGPDQLRELDAVIEKSITAKTADAIAEAWRGGLLSAPQTHIVNGLGSTITLLGEMADRAVAAQFARALGPQGHSVEVGEAAAMAQGMVAGFRDTMRYASKVLKGQTPDTEASGLFTQGPKKVEAANVGAISSQAFNIDNGSVAGRFVDVLGTVFRAPVEALGASDTLFKTMNWRAELYAQAFRQTQKELRAGTLAKDDLAKRTAELLDNPPASMLEAARTAALDRTFTASPGPMVQSILNLRNKTRLGPLPIGHILLPFVSTPANIMRYAFLRTPLAPLFAEYRQAMNAGGAAQELALTRMTSGTMISLLAADMAMNGQLSGAGPADAEMRQNLRRDGWQPYSVKVGDRWFAYNRLDPLGMTLGLGADLAEITANTDWTDQGAEEFDEAAALAIGSIGSVMMSKTYLQGVADFTEFMSDPKRYGEGWLMRLGSTFAVPAGVAAVRRIEDPVIRDAASVMEAIKNRVPGLSKELPARVDLWGRQISYQSGLGVLYDAFSPVYSRKAGGEAIDGEMIRLRVNVQMPDRSLSVGGEAISLKNRREIYNRYVALAGNELKANGMGAKDFLNAVVEGNHPMSEFYAGLSNGPDGGKAEFIKKVVTRYRTAARYKLIEEYPELRSEAERMIYEKSLAQ